MITLAELQEAGFSAAQADLLLRMQLVLDETSAQRFQFLAEAMNRGHAQILTTMQRGFSDLRDELRGEMRIGFGQISDHLDGIDEHLGRPGVN